MRCRKLGVWLPVLRPQPVRWLDLAIVVDESPSMRIWARTLAQLRQLLEQIGAFRDIRQWRLSTDGRNQSVILRAYEGNTQRHYKELINPGSSRLILLVSDCVSPAWQGQELLDWINAWGEKHPVGLVQMLPQSLWPQTQLYPAWHVKASASSPATANGALRWQSASAPWLAARHAASRFAVASHDVGILVLIVWTRFITGVRGAAVPAFIGKAQAPPPSCCSPQRTKSTAWNNFASCLARSLWLVCHLVALAPLRLPIMRLVQQVILLPVSQSRQTHLAEFFS